MHLTLLLIFLVSILVSGLQSSLTTTPREENESVRDAVSVRVEQDTTAPPSKHNGSTQEAEHTITYPSRLIYYMNEESESTYHNLNTRAKIPGQQGQCNSLTEDVKPVHLAQASFQLEAFGSRFILDLILNK
ncbi:hypothetical protein QTP70_027132 [Hemibagrus guttatus]|uniref:Uncharacterized protein n=1 Tax=Hemibagrus guttatus TaxID=175788 RepID=A0AAE0R5T5_9TELE|nr:hypothetical protein QTP70_027132 [Hemibagrus guttatus]